MGDLVWCLDEYRKVGITPKIGWIYDGPVLVTKRFSDSISQYSYIRKVQKMG